MKTFAELAISPELMRAITDLEYVTPSAIQALALPILLDKPTDFIGLAATGTGKTAAFGIPMLERIDASKRTPQALVLCPTRELAMQVSGQINILGKHLKIRSLPIYGGAGFDAQLRGLRDGVQVIVGTPGRLVDHLKRGTLKLGDLKMLILDEADEMISMGFKDELEAILQAMPRATSNIWLFSATMNREVRRVADTYLKDPEQVQANRKEMLSNTVEQIFYMTKEVNKPEVLCKLIDAAENFFGIIFCQTKLLVIDLTRYLTERGYKVDCLHGDKDQKSREKTMQLFRDRRVSILICTDVASRGLDVKDITHVVNYSIPHELDSYVHRIGRTARSGKSGIAMSLVTSSHRMLIGRIEKMTNSRMREGFVPTQKEITQIKVNQVLTAFKEQDSTSHAHAALSANWKAEIAELSKEEIVARFLAMHFPDMLKNLDTIKHHALMGDDPQREERREYRDQRSHFRRDDDRKPWAKPSQDRRPARDYAPKPYVPAYKPQAATAPKPHAPAAYKPHSAAAQKPHASAAYKPHAAAAQKPHTPATPKPHAATTAKPHATAYKPHAKATHKPHASASFKPHVKAAHKSPASAGYKPHAAAAHKPYAAAAKPHASAAYKPHSAKPDAPAKGKSRKIFVDGKQVKRSGKPQPAPFKKGKHPNKKFDKR